MCTGQGECVAPDMCQFYSSISSGLQCQINEYLWKGFPGAWSNTLNWFVARGSQLVETNTIPGVSGDRVIIDAPGTYTVLVDVTTLNLASLVVGSSSSSVIIDFNNFNGKTIKIQGNFDLHPASVFSTKNSKWTVAGLGTIGLGAWNNVTLGGNWQIPTGGTFFYNSGSMSDINLKVNGVLQFDAGSIVNTDITIAAGAVLNQNGGIQYVKSSITLAGVMNVHQTSTRGLNVIETKIQIQPNGML